MPVIASTSACLATVRRIKLKSREPEYSFMRFLESMPFVRARLLQWSCVKRVIYVAD